MVRVTSPFGYQDPTAEIGYNLGRALFGDPEAAAKQAAQAAQMDQHRAAAEADRQHARLYGSQADGQGAQNTASAGLPELMASFAPMPGETTDQAFRRGLPGLVARIGQAQGDKINTSETIGSLASFLGGDEMARRGMVAQGHSPSADFAITPERADAIAGNDALAKLKQALGVADVRADATRYAVDERSAAAKYRSDASAGASRYRADVMASRPAAVRTKAPSKAAAGPIATNAQGHKVQWNGKAWVGIN